MKTWFAIAALSLGSLSALAADTQPTDAQIDAAFKKADPDSDGTVSPTAPAAGVVNQPGASRVPIDFG